MGGAAPQNREREGKPQKSDVAEYKEVIDTLLHIARLAQSVEHGSLKPTRVMGVFFFDF